MAVTLVASLPFKSRQTVIRNVVRYRQNAAALEAVTRQSVTGLAAACACV